MGIREMPVATPDTFGLPEFYVTEVVTEKASDGDIRIICGVKRGNRIHWLYCTVMPADKLLEATRRCEAAALEVFEIEPMMDRIGAH